ncbi:serine/threonine-protein kinase [Candidatus Uabimicrobium sp. HlEnr_7]|uniref:serine/threonine-protein kinase n=1 Tax=Candidatus Uabimicrobium helgolandensis TaxID=3095367 RepID=UPI003557659B
MNLEKMKDLLSLGMSSGFNPVDNKSSNSDSKQDNIVSCGQMLNRYFIVEEIGRGGMGVVYKAIDEKLCREVALKVLCSGNTDSLLQEARSIAQLNHPNIVQIFEVCEDPVPFFTMELVCGNSLSQFIQQHSKKFKDKEYFRKITAIFVDIATALHFAHEKNTIHRDVKPENIILDSELKPKIMDFGLAQHGIQTPEKMAGTPAYMSPEQVQSLSVGNTSDIYSLGATLYETMTMNIPFQGDSILNTIYQVVIDEPIRPRLLNPKIPKDLEAICLKCLEKKPKKRYCTMNNLKEDLTNYLDNHPVSAKSPSSIERLWKFGLRNKAIFISVLIILSITLFYFHGIYSALKAENKAFSERNIAIKEKKKVLLKHYLNITNNYVSNQEITAANESLETLKSLYKDVSNQKEHIELNWLQKKCYQQKYMKDLHDKSKLFFTNENMIEVTHKGDIYSYKSGRETGRNIQYSIPAIHSVCISPDYKYIAILRGLNANCRLELHDVKTLKMVFRKKINDNYDRICSFYDSDTLLIGGRSLRIWKLENNSVTELKSIDSFSEGVVGYGDEFTISAISANLKKQTVAFIYSGVLYTYSFKNKQIAKILSKEYYTCCQYYAEDNLLLGSSSGKLYNIAQDLSVKEIGNHKSEVKKIVYAQKNLFTCTSNGEIFRWDLNSRLLQKIITNEDVLSDFTVYNKVLFTLTEHKIYYSRLSQPNPTIIEENGTNVNIVGNHYTTAGGFGKVVIRNLKTKTEQQNIGWFKAKYAFFEPMTNTLIWITGYGDRQVYIRDKTSFSTEKLKKDYPNISFFEKEVVGGLYCKKNKRFFLYNLFGELTVWDLTSRKLLQELYHGREEINDAGVLTANLSADGRYIVFIFRYSFTGNDKSILVFDLEKNAYKKIKIEYRGSNTKVKLTFLNGIRSLILCFENFIKIWDFNKLMSGEKSSITLKKHKNFISSFSLAQDNKRLISTDYDGRILMWNLENVWSKEKSDYFLFEIQKRGKTISDSVYSESLQKLITVGEDTRIWDFALE